MLAQLRAAVVSLARCSPLLTGVAYPLARHRASRRRPSRSQANGSLIVAGRQARRLAAHRPAVRRPEVLLGPPVGDRRRERQAARLQRARRRTGSNLGPTNPALLDAVKARVDALRAADPDNARAGPGRPRDVLGERARPAHLAGRGASTRCTASRARAASTRRRVRALVAAAHRGPPARLPRRAAASTCSQLNLALDALALVTSCAGAPMTDAAPDPGRAPRRGVREDERAAARGKLDDLLRRRARRRQDVRDARGGARAARDEGVDVVVGIVETHGRDETEALLDRPRAPARAARVEYRGIDARGVRPRRRPRAPARSSSSSTSSRTPTRPASRHAKRWQDVEELLDAGIDVYTTLNVQHLESLNDVVAQITGVRVRETVPDRVFERADEVKLGRPAARRAARAAAARARSTCRGRPSARSATSSAGQPDRAARARAAPHRRARRRADARLHAGARHRRRSWAGASASWSCVAASPLSARLVRAARRMADAPRAPSGSRSTSRPPRFAPPAGGRARAGRPEAAPRRAARRRGGDPARRATSRDELVRYARAAQRDQDRRRQADALALARALAPLAGRRRHPPQRRHRRPRDHRRRAERAARRAAATASGTPDGSGCGATFAAAAIVVAAASAARPASGSCRSTTRRWSSCRRCC